MAFTGKASYSSRVEIEQDISDRIFALSIMDTPLLNTLGDAGTEAKDVEHFWTTDALNPHVATLSANVASSDGASEAIGLTTNAHAKVGQIFSFESDGKTNHEKALVTSKTGANTVYITRAQGGTSATSHAQNDVLRIIGSGALEGDTPSAGNNTNRKRVNNWTQIFESFINISGTRRAQLMQIGGIGDELNHQTNQRAAELLRELEQSIINGVTLGNTIGSETARRFFAGVIGSKTSTQSIGALTSSQLDNVLQLPYDEGASPDLIVVGILGKRKINNFQGSSVRADQSQNNFVRNIFEYEAHVGVQEVMLNRYMDANKIWVQDKSRIRVLPHVGRSFGAKDLGDDGDRSRRQVIGEYTIEDGNEKAGAVGTNMS